jgi:flagellar hook-associated protein 3 FlgL
MYTRITSKMMMSNYKSTLSYTMNGVDSTSRAVTNERKYQNDSEDPVSATRAYQYRRETTKAENYKNNTQSVNSLLSTRESVLMELSSMVRTAFQDDIGAATGTSSDESRLAYSQDLRQTQKAIIQCLNTSYGGSYLFGGTSTKSVPFALDDDGNVTYRGVPVDGGDDAVYAGKTATERLAEYENETQYVDLGFGLNDEAGGTINDNSAFNIVCNATTFLGTGTDSNGNSLNLIQLLGDMADALDCNEMTYDDDYFQQLSQNFEKCMTNLTIQLTQIGSDENLMTSNESRLDTMLYNLQEKTNNTEYITEAEAITNFQEAQYTYKAALQIGTQILSQSFLDYMG